MRACDCKLTAENLRRRIRRKFRRTPLSSLRDTDAGPEKHPCCITAPSSSRPPSTAATRPFPSNPLHRQARTSDTQRTYFTVVQLWNQAACRARRSADRDTTAGNFFHLAYRLWINALYTFRGMVPATASPLRSISLTGHISQLYNCEIWPRRFGDDTALVIDRPHRPQRWNRTLVQVCDLKAQALGARPLAAPQNPNVGPEGIPTLKRHAALTASV